MTSFVFIGNKGDGHVVALTKAINVASRMSKDALLEFTDSQLNLSTNADISKVYFVFHSGFFTDYQCIGKHRCYVHLKALQLPLRSMILNSDRENGFRPQIKLECVLEDTLNNQLVFKISQAIESRGKVTNLKYKIPINELDDERRQELDRKYCSLKRKTIVISPNQNKNDRFLLSAFNSFAPDIDIVSIKATQQEIKFIGSKVKPLANDNTTSEFTHTKDDFSRYEVREKLSIGIPLKHLKYFLTFVETNRLQTLPCYIFEDVGEPAHFIYKSDLFEGHFVSATECDYVPEDCDNELLAITSGADESFIVEDDLKDFNIEEDLDKDDESSTGYNDEDSDDSQYSDHLDGNLDGLPISTNRTYDDTRARQILRLDEDFTQNEELDIQYQSDESLD